MLNFEINGSQRTIEDIDPATPLLWVLRDALGLVGAKYGCGIGQCGACTVLMDGEPIRSCSIGAGAASEHSITTIEGLAAADGILHPLQEAWIALDVPQCGYCQSGQLMSAAALLARNPQPTDAEIEGAMAGNLCRCGTYLRIRQGIHTAAAAMRERHQPEHGQ